MSYTTKSGKKRYNLYERSQYHYKRAQKGVCDNSGREISDFKRGEHLGRAKELQNQNNRRIYKLKKENGIPIKKKKMKKSYR